jgi:hypothetical protein
MNRYDRGKKGEAEVVALARCPNCRGDLMTLPEGYPLYDVQCRKCLFRAQVKTFASRPANVMYGSGWDILQKTMRSGHLVPPLIINCKWRHKGESHHAIRFYPLVPHANLKPRIAHIKGNTTKKSRLHKMFNYIGMTSLPFMPLHEK